MDDQLVDAIKHLASDPTADTKVKKKLLSILASWSTQFKNDPSLSTIAGLYKQSRPIDRRSHGRSESADTPFRTTPTSPNDKDAAKKRAKQEKEDAKERTRKADEEARQLRIRSRKAPFNFDTVSITSVHSPRTSHTLFRRNPKY